MSIEVKLSIFEGPLDLLLFLIKKDEIDIYDIPIIEITNQYMEYLKLMKRLNLEIAGEFLIMASTLMYIKSKMLLPKEEIALEEEIDPREELVQQLLEYEKYKKIADKLKELELVQKDIFIRFPSEIEFEEEEKLILNVNIFDLLEAFKNVVKKVEISIIEITKEEFTIEQKEKEILNFLKNEQIINFNEIFRLCKSKMEIIVTFLTLLELVRQKKIKIWQEKLFSEIKIFRPLLPVIVNV